jgi:hypothetical protein
LPISRVGTLADDASETRVEGRLNNGGPDFIVTTSNGNITFQALPEE